MWLCVRINALFCRHLRCRSMERAFLGLDLKSKVSYNINISGLWKVLHIFLPHIFYEF